ncbi:Clavaminate synthase-like protein [Clavulina sp. PMI_390]|nr:Clavaminate synthase-like protein [Clavulina sp. PMI_390]
MASSVPQANPVIISYNDLASSPETLKDSIAQAFGSEPDCLGIIVVKDLPKEYPALRQRLLSLANSFAGLDEQVREKYTDPSTHYSFGWSHGKEIMNGIPDVLKGSYYANPTVDHPVVSEQARRDHPEVYGSNIWPAADEKGVEGFEDAFKALGGLVFDVGCKMASACQPFVSVHLRDNAISLPTLISKSQTLKARLLHYFPPPAASVAPASADEDDEAIDSWCGFHKDHSMLTGLCSAMYLSHGKDTNEVQVVQAPNPTSGLYIRTRGGDLRRVGIPVDCLAFQTGEALEVATSGSLRATPHCVHVGRSPDSAVISRETFALFMAPDTDQALSAEETYGQFSKRIIESHYAPGPMM